MAESKIADDSYFVVQGWMLKRMQLKGIALEVFAIVYGFSQDGESSFTGSLQYLCDFTNTSRPTVIKALKDLVEKGYILRYENEVNGVKFNKYKANLQVVKNLYRGSKETLQQAGKETLQGGSKETLHNNKSLENKGVDNKYKTIIDYLNAKAGTAYRATSMATQQHINARLAEGFTVEDFQRVIDNKCADWLGSEWEQYLRPSTLFGSKFEQYLNSKPKQTKGANGIAVSSSPSDLDGVF